MGGWVGGWVGGVCYCSLRLSQPSLAGAGAGAELRKKLVSFGTRGLLSSYILHDNHNIQIRET